METKKLTYYVCEYRDANNNNQRDGFFFSGTSFDNAYKQIRQWKGSNKNITIIAIREA